MEIQELFARLDRHRGSFPQNLADEAIARREEAIPVFLEILDDIDRNPDRWAAHEERMVHVYAMYLLALFRGKARLSAAGKGSLPAQVNFHSTWPALW